MYFNFILNIKKLIKGKKYLITGASDIKPDFVKKCEVKFPQTVLFNGEWLIVKDIDGFSGWAKEFFVLKCDRQATLEIYKTKKGLSYRKIASNGKILNHQYNTMAGLKKGIEAEKRFWENYKVVTK